MKDNFTTCLEETLKWEGGYTNHPLDPGGPTNLGIIQERYDQYNKDSGRSKKSVKSITKEEAIDIYRRYYWNAVKGDDLPSGLDVAVFDFGVNSGPSRANTYYNRYKDINQYMDAREKFLKSLQTFPTFGKGWLRRTAGIRKKALQMAGTPTLKDIKKEVVSNSSKLSVFKGFRNIGSFVMAALAGIFSLDTLNLATTVVNQLKAFMSDYGVLVILGVIGISWIVLKWGEWKQLLDYREGRYIPSGLVQGSSVDASTTGTA